MKQVDIGGFVLVEVLIGSINFEIKERVTLPHLFYHYNKPHYVIPQPHYELIAPGNYQIVGLAKDLTPDQWCEIFGTEYDAHCFMKQNKLLHETTLIIKKML